jgi:hypothetical protein
LTTTTGHHQTAVAVQSTSQQQKKKQCSSPLSSCGDKTSACSTPSLSPIKNEPLIMIDTTNRHDTSTPLLLAMPAVSRYSPLQPASSANSSTRHSSQKQKNSNDTSLLSFEGHELSAGNGTLMSTRDQDDFKLLEAPSPLHATTAPATTTADWSYFITVGDGISKELEKPAPSSTSSSSSSSSSSGGSTQDESHTRRHHGGFEFFVDGQHASARELYNSWLYFSFNFLFQLAEIVQLPSLQSALQTRRADFLATSQKRVDDIKTKDYSTAANISHVPIPSRSRPQKQTTTTTVVSSTAIVETDSEERQRRARESKERSKRLYDQLAEVQQKKKFTETKQQAQAYRARMNAFQTALDKKKTNNKK